MNSHILGGYTYKTVMPDGRIDTCDDPGRDRAIAKRKKRLLGQRVAARSDNLFAIVVLAHLKVQETKRNIQQRKAWKFRLTKMLYERGYERQQILNLYRFLDWLIILPEALEQELWQELQTYEEARKVAYVTNAERFGFERGIQEGEQRGEQRGRQEEGLNLIFRQLTRRIGPIASTQETQIRSLSLVQLEDLGEALLDFTQPADLDNWLQSRS